MREVLDRRIARVPALRGHTVVNLFYENSTRTRASFELAGKVLGADVISLSANTSSVSEGRVAHRYRAHAARDGRRRDRDAPLLGRRGLPRRRATPRPRSSTPATARTPIPTQALLDLYTMRKHFGDLRGKRVVMVGDISHSRVARSDMWGLAAMGAEVVVCGPPTLLPRGLRAQDRPAHAESALPPVHVETDIDRAIEGAARRDGAPPAERAPAGRPAALAARVRRATTRSRRARLARAHPDAPADAPRPEERGHRDRRRRRARAATRIIEEQVTNGVAVRMALLYLLAGMAGRPAPAPMESHR